MSVPSNGNLPHSKAKRITPNDQTSKGGPIQLKIIKKRGNNFMYTIVLVSYTSYINVNTYVSSQSLPK
jgi:hypothetical protein